MNAIFRGLAIAAVLLLPQIPLRLALCEETLFEDNFKGKLSDKWQVAGLKKGDYRVRDGGLEMRVQPGKWTSDMPTLKVTLPFEDDQTVIVSVKVTLLDMFTKDGEFAGVYFLDEDGSVFKGTKEQQGGKLVFTPAADDFVGEDGEEDDPTKYKTLIVNETPEAGPLRIVVDHGYAFFQVGPSTKGAYVNHFYSAIRNKPKLRGFGLIASGAPEGASHWVRFENFRVFKR